MIDWSFPDDQLDAWIEEQAKTKSIRKIAKELHVSSNTLRNRIKKRNLKVKIKRKVNDWKAIVEHIRDTDLPFYKSIGLYPVELRQLYYRLIEVGILTKSKSNYGTLSSVTSEARRGCNSSYTKNSIYGKLPMSCIYDKGIPAVLGSTDRDDYPKHPTPAGWPDDWFEYLEGELDSVRSAVDSIDDIPDNYDGSITSGSDGENPGKCYLQPKHTECWVESGNLVKTIDKLVGDLVQVTACGGIASTSMLAYNCERIKKIKDNHECIEQIIILYCGDLDSTGDWLDEYLVKAIQYYTGWTHHKEFELVRVAVLPEQIKSWNLVENPDFSPEENGDPRFERFAEKYPELVEEYGQKFGIQVEAMLTTKIKVNKFKELLRNKILEFWDENIWKRYCPPEEYDYDANDEEEPCDTDIDEDYPDPTDYELRPEESEMTMRQIMENRIRLLKQELRDSLAS